MAALVDAELRYFETHVINNLAALLTAARAQSDFGKPVRGDC